jgi:hypothetical protein
MAGNSFMVTVSAPNAPCRHTHTSVARATTDAPAAPRLRCSQVPVASVRISTPTPVAR